eukprot:TRINITY_DN38160_c0_g1_i1.p1 TRINITY_DN38160_c0_g1~~TRINITY_DN38160_c0_g1_i1.p1  ORF type:complete len:338 (+),score=58.07 TRINITY_DN38160_c0_g1_i1:58-1071(+)
MMEAHEHDHHCYDESEHEYDVHIQSMAIVAFAGLVGAMPRRKRQALPMVIPPLRFTLVEAGVYRGGYPVLFNYRFMKRLKLRMIISLIPEGPSQDLQDFCFFEKIDLRHYQAEKFKESPVLMISDVTQILELVVDPANHPLYIHCLDGGHVTGSVVVALRKLQGWDTASVVEEHRRWASDKEVTSDELAYIDEFHSDFPLAVPTVLPQWLWGGDAVDIDGNLKRNKLFPRLRFPVNIQDPKNPPETQPPPVFVGSMSTLYSLTDFLTQLVELAPPTAPPHHTTTSLWSPRTSTFNIAHSRTFQSLWLDPGPAGSFSSPPPPRLPPTASSYSDLRCLF